MMRTSFTYDVACTHVWLSFWALAPSNVPSSTACPAKIANALNSNLQPNTNVMSLGPTAIPPAQMDPRLGSGGRNGAYNFNYFAPGVNNPVAGSTNGSGRFPGSGLHVPLSGGADPVIPNFGPGIYVIVQMG